MHSSASGQLPGADATVDPAWQPWLRLLGLALAEAGDSAWSAMVPAPGQRPAGAPLLHGTMLRLDTTRTSSFVRRLADAIDLTNVDAIEPKQLVLGAISRDDVAITEIAERAGAPIDTMTVLAQVAALPLLHACARELAAAVPKPWQRGWCPVCGAWPSLAEIRGIDRQRRLRCGCCGCDWAFPVLRCAFCDEVDHRKLGSLAPEGEEQHRRVETCDGCRGYLKSVTTLLALPPHLLALHDLATVPLDLAAQDRGYARPTRPGWTPSVGLIA